MTPPFDPAHPEWARLRAATGRSQDALAALVHLSGRGAWWRLESGARGEGRPDLARWTLALLLTDHHPTLRAVERQPG